MIFKFISFLGHKNVKISFITADFFPFKKILSTLDNLNYKEIQMSLDYANYKFIKTQKFKDMNEMKIAENEIHNNYIIGNSV